MKTSLLFLLFLIYGWNSYAQNFQLQILGSTESETKTIDSLKYNTKHSPKVEIKYKDNIFSVFNTGEKIDTKNLFIVFDKYFQENQTKDGFGLGLAMVKEFCDKNRISINIDTLENGNRFNLNLKNL